MSAHLRSCLAGRLQLSGLLLLIVAPLCGGTQPFHLELGKLLAGGNMSYDVATAACGAIENYNRLCYARELCPDGRIEGGPLGKAFAGDVFVPVADAQNEWLQLGDVGEQTCWSHNGPVLEGLLMSLYAGEPDWAPADKQSHRKNHIFCCPPTVSEQEAAAARAAAATWRVAGLWSLGGAPIAYVAAQYGVADSNLRNSLFRSDVATAAAGLSTLAIYRDSKCRDPITPAGTTWGSLSRRLSSGNASTAGNASAETEASPTVGDNTSSAAVTTEATQSSASGGTTSTTAVTAETTQSSASGGNTSTAGGNTSTAAVTETTQSSVSGGSELVDAAPLPHASRNPPCLIFQFPQQLVRDGRAEELLRDARVERRAGGSWQPVYTHSARWVDVADTKRLVLFPDHDLFGIDVQHALPWFAFFLVVLFMSHLSLHSGLLLEQPMGYELKLGIVIEDLKRWRVFDVDGHREGEKYAHQGVRDAAILWIQDHRLSQRQHDALHLLASLLLALDAALGWFLTFTHSFADPGSVILCWIAVCLPPLLTFPALCIGTWKSHLWWRSDSKRCELIEDAHAQIQVQNGATTKIESLQTGFGWSMPKLGGGLLFMCWLEFCLLGGLRLVSAPDYYVYWAAKIWGRAPPSQSTAALACHAVAAIGSLFMLIALFADMGLQPTALPVLEEVVRNSCIVSSGLVVLTFVAKCYRHKSNRHQGAKKA
eukprot:TRINITY_DN8688_c1_g1_i1.p1 TRINITY_DN8688_c1_g1~~TRINITY_DN8688_c1_g1_i1.p1  ORF type:complete len:711 (+),score=91.81 TRINITY_DN8688_c1_g1_i1:122-2254(+)